MALLNNTYNTADLPESNSFDPLPAGWYSATIQETDLRMTKAGNGQYIWLKMAVTGPSHQGRIIFTNLNIQNPNPQAEDIGKQQLGEMLRAIGLPTIQDTDQLVGGSLMVKLTVKRSEEYGDGNEVKGFKAIAGSGAPSMAPSAPPQAPMASTPPPQAYQQPAVAPSATAPASQPAAATPPPWAQQ